MTTILERRNALLDEAKALVLKGWCQFGYVADGNGTTLALHDILKPSAKCFCARGAVLRAERRSSDGPTKIDRTSAIIALENAAYKIVGINPSPDISDRIAVVADYNDAKERTRYEIAALFDHSKEMPL